MRALAALLLHIFAVHYLFVLFTIGVPCLVVSLILKRTYLVKHFRVKPLLLAVFGTTLVGGLIFPPVNVWYLKHFGMEGAAVIIGSSEEGKWFSKAPEVRLILKIVPAEGTPFIESMSTVPPLDTLSRLQVGGRLEVLYSPQYTHDIAITAW